MSRMIFSRLLPAGLLVGFLVGTLSQNGMSTPAMAQEKCDSDVVDFEGASGRSTILNGVETIALTRPILLQCKTELIAERGTREALDRYRFEGNVRIVERGDTVYADNVLYFSGTKIGQASGNVLITDGRVQLTAPEAVYFTEEKRTVFNNGVLFEDSTTALTSQIGIYWSDDKKAQFTSDVRLWQESLYMEADGITYWRDEEITRAAGHVYVERSERGALPEGGAQKTHQRQSGRDARKTRDARTSRTQSDGADQLETDMIIIFGDSVFHNARLDSTRISGKVDMLQIQRDSTGTADSLFVRSREMTIAHLADSDRVIAVGGVQVVQGSLGVTGDSLVYLRDLGGENSGVSTRMYESPMAWLKQTQISADSLWMNSSNTQIDSLRASGGVFVAEHDSLLNRIQQLKGHGLFGLFERGSLQSMTVAPNAEALYFVEADEESKQAAVRSSADRIVFTFENGSVVDVRSYQGVEGTFFPSSLVEQTENLEGYIYTPERKPEFGQFRMEWARRMMRRQAGDIQDR